MRQHRESGAGITRRVAAAAFVVALSTLAAGVARAPAAAPPGAVVPPALLDQAQQSPGATFNVIVQGSSPAGAGQLVRAAAQAAPGDAAGVRLELQSVDGVAAQLTGKQLLQLAKARGISAITPDAPVQLAGNLSNKQQWPFVSGVARGWSSVTSGSLGRAPAIAVVDSGIDAGRADFGNRVVKQVTLTSLPTNSPGDGYGHGTFVAGIAADSASGYAGAAPSANLVSIDVLDDNGMAMTSDVIAAADWILQNKSAYNIRVANFSLQATSPASIFWDPLDRAVEKLWLSGVVVVTAAGNYAVNGRPSGVLFAPGNDPFVITVGADDVNSTVSTNDDFAAPWSSYGYTFDGFAKPDLAAPGRYMIGPVPTGSTLVAQRPWAVTSPGYMQLSGTSFAAPVVSGAAAYLLALHPDWTPDQVKGALMLTTNPSPVAAPLSEGVGIVDAAHAADVVSPPNPNLALEQFLIADPTGGSTPIFDAASWGSTAGANASWGSASWGSASWGSALWSAASWGTSSWSSASWGTASWGTASWGTASWGTASWGSASIADNAAADVGPPALLNPAQAAEASAELGFLVTPDGSVNPAATHK